VKVLTVLVLFLAYFIPAQADTWDVTASACTNDPPPDCVGPANLSAVFATIEETGTFEYPFTGGTIEGTFPVITSMSGTFNGEPISLGPLLQGANGAIVNYPFTTAGGTPEDVTFSEGGDICELNFDNGEGVELSCFQGINTFVNWSAVDVPEPSSATLLMISLSVLLLLGLMRWAQMSLRKLSGRI
jgi:hypothetical protein